MNQQNQFWWQIDDETEMGNLLTGLIEQLKDNHRPRHNNNLDMLRMYTGRDNDNLGRSPRLVRYIGFGLALPKRETRVSVILPTTFNLIRSLSPTLPILPVLP